MDQFTRLWLVPVRTNVWSNTRVCCCFWKYLSKLYSDCVWLAAAPHILNLCANLFFRRSRAVTQTCDSHLHDAAQQPNGDTVPAAAQGSFSRRRICCSESKHGFFKVVDSKSSRCNLELIVICDPVSTVSLMTRPPKPNSTPDVFVLSV